MSDAVFDTSVVAYANVAAGVRKHNWESLGRRSALLQSAVSRRVRVRYNPKLLIEYTQHVKRGRNDLIEAFFAILDSPSAIAVRSNNLTRQKHQLATGEGWPSHDEHLLAAAIEGDRPTIYVTEVDLGVCAAGIHRVFRIHVRLV
jgi:hypothetical protein